MRLTQQSSFQQFGQQVRFGLASGFSNEFSYRIGLVREANVGGVVPFGSSHLFSLCRFPALALVQVYQCRAKRVKGLLGIAQTEFRDSVLAASNLFSNQFLAETSSLEVVND